MVIPDLWPALRGLSPVHPGLSPAFKELSLVHSGLWLTLPDLSPALSGFSLVLSDATEGLRNVLRFCQLHRSSAQCKSVRTQHALCQLTAGDLTSSANNFNMLPDTPAAKKWAFRLYKSILRYSCKHLPRWRCTQDATRFDLLNSHIW